MCVFSNAIYACRAGKSITDNPFNINTHPKEFEQWRFAFLEEEAFWEIELLECKAYNDDYYDEFDGEFEFLTMLD